MKFANKLFIFTLLVLTFTSCSNKSESLKTIPDSVSGLVSIDLESLYSKGHLSDMEDFKLVKFIQGEMKNEDQKVKNFFDKFIDDPRVCGLNLREDLFIYSINEGNENNYTCFNAELSDEEEFLDFIKEFLEVSGAPFAMNIVERDNFKYAEFDKEAILGWSDNNVILCIAQNYGSRENLEYCIKQAFNLSADKSLAESESFEGFYDNHDDINLYATSNQLVNNREYREIARQLDYDLTNNAVIANLDFEEDQIKMKLRTILNEDMQEAVEMLDIGSSIDDDLLEYLPADNYIVGGFHLDMESYVASVKKQKDFDQVAKEIEKEIGYTIDEIAEAFEGDIAFNVFDFTVGRYDQANPVYAVVLNVDNEDLIENLMKKMEEEGFRKKNGYYSLSLDPENNMCFALNEDHIMITNEEGTIKQFVEGALKNNLGDEDIADLMLDNPMYFGMKLNVLDYPQSVIRTFKDLRGDEQMMLDMWNKSVKNMDAKMIDANNYEIQLNLIPDGENSFYRLLKLIDDNFQNVL